MTKHARTSLSCIAAAALGLTLAVATSACDRGSSGSPAGEAPAPAQSAKQVIAKARAAERVGFAVELASGEFISFEPYERGYKVEGPGLEGSKLKIDADRVKLGRGSQTLAKVKQKDYGFKVYKDDTNATLKAKLKGSGYGVALAGGDKLGKLATASGGRGQLAGEVTEVNVQGASIEVRRGGQLLAKVPAHIGVKPASFMALKELTIAERVSAMIFVVEKQP